MSVRGQCEEKSTVVCWMSSNISPCCMRYVSTHSMPHYGHTSDPSPPDWQRKIRLLHALAQPHARAAARASESLPYLSELNLA